MISRQVVKFFTLVVILYLTKAEEKKNEKDLVLKVTDGQMEQYLNQNSSIHTYNYGYEVNKHNQFHHQTHGSDGITYGCYGYTNAYGNLTAIFYVSDGWGYRVVLPDKNVKLFSFKVKDGQEHLLQGVVSTPWKNLPFPTVCGEFKKYSTRDDQRIIFAVEKKKPEEPIVEKVYGPWPTGSPGPNGPWPGDPDYVPITKVKLSSKKLTSKKLT